ncbi:MAG TPA: MFS transporter [Methylomirabilota bacterium]|nr:MFS transporter [Methylomirabilota bacterium]
MPAADVARQRPVSRSTRVFYGWIVLAAAVALITVGVGITFSLAVFLKPLEEQFGWSRSLISGIALVNWLIFGLGAFGWGALSDRIGARRVVAAGAGLLGAAMLLSSRITTAWQLYVAFGILGAAGSSAFYVPLSATVTRWFAARRGLALGLLSGGMGLGILVVPPLARALITAFDWRATFAIFGVLTWTVALVAVRWLHDRPRDLGLREYGVGADGPVASEATAGMDSGQALRHPAFWVIAIVHFGCCAAHSGPIFHMVAHAMDLGVAKMAAASMLGLSGAASIAGRIGSGLLADRFGAKPALVGMLTLQAMTLSGYLAAHEELPLFGVALAFGVAYGGAMPLYALVAREFFGERVIGTAFGGIFLVSAIGMGLGAYAGGWLFDWLGSYWSLYVSSTLVGIAAVAVALTLRAPTPARALAGGR